MKPAGRTKGDDEARTIRTARQVGAVAATLMTAVDLAAGAVAARATDDPADDQAPLRELRTATNQGWSYTLDHAEAQRASREFGFHPSATLGALHTTDRQQRRSVHRPRDKDRKSYMLSISPGELRRAGYRVNGPLGWGPAPGHRFARRTPVGVGPPGVPDPGWAGVGGLPTPSSPSHHGHSTRDQGCATCPGPCAPTTGPARGSIPVPRTSPRTPQRRAPVTRARPSPRACEPWR